MDWTEAHIYTATEGIEPVCGRLLGIGITGFVIRDKKDFEEFLQNKEGNWDYLDDSLMELRDCETRVTVYLPHNSQGADMLAALRSEVEALRELDTDGKFGRLAVEISDVREEDWEGNWKQYFKPIEVGKKLVIKPSWEKYRNPDGRTVLEIDPASSFGTGQHSTTKLCLELLEELVKGGERVLDLGCGSGILSIGAALLGAESVTAVDTDQNSVRTAAENAGKNHIPPERYRAYWGNIITDKALRERIGGGYDIIAANIVADVIIAMGPYFGEFLKSGGTLILSGIISERTDEVIKAVTEKGYALAEVRESDGWAACLMGNS